MTTRLQTYKTAVQSLLDDLIDSFYFWKMEKRLAWPWESQGHLHSSGNFICWLWGHQFDLGPKIETLTRSQRITTQLYCKRCLLSWHEFDQENMILKGIFIKWRIESIFQ